MLMRGLDSGEMIPTALISFRLHHLLVESEYAFENFLSTWFPVEMEVQDFGALG
jgi:hypothetical protein